MTSEDKGPLASLIIKGLEGKTVAQIDATGNASFSGQLAADSLKINNDATIAGSLRAKEIEAENIKVIEDRLNVIASEAKQSLPAGRQVKNEIASSPPRNDNELNNQINDIQKLLAEIKNQPLPDPQYYQKIASSVIANLRFGGEAISSSNGIATSPSAPRNDSLENLTVTGSSNLYNLAVTGSSTIGNLLIQDNSILSLAWDLKLSALGDIKLFDNAVVIGKDGTIQTKGKIIAEDGVKTNKIEPLTPTDKVTINNLAINNLAIENKYLA